MKRRPSLPVGDIFGRSLATREARVAALAQVAEALTAGQMPDQTHARFVGQAITAWLLSMSPAKESRLESFLEVAPGDRSPLTPQRLYRNMLMDGAGDSRGQED